MSPFLKDLNCHCIDPTKDLVLNPAAWTNPADGQFGAGRAVLQRLPLSAAAGGIHGLGRVFKFREGMALTLRMNFQNIFNRTGNAKPDRDQYPCAQQPQARMACSRADSGSSTTSAEARSSRRAGHARDAAPILGPE